MFLLWFTLCWTLCASWTWVWFLQQYREIFSHCFFKGEFIFLSSPWIPIMWMLVCLILSTKCLKLSSIFWLIFFFLVLRSGDFHYSVFLCLFLKYECIYFNWRPITLQYGSGSALHWHESATGAHVLPVLRPRPLLWVSPVHRHCSVCQLTDLSSESSNLLTHLLYFSCQLLYSSIIISSFLYLLPVCGVLTLFFHASPDTSKYLLFVYLMGPLGLAVSLAFSSCIEWGLHSVMVRGLPIILSSLVEHRL